MVAVSNICSAFTMWMFERGTSKPIGFPQGIALERFQVLLVDQPIASPGALLGIELTVLHTFPVSGTVAASPTAASCVSLLVC
jgi:hypothetical protein